MRATERQRESRKWGYFFVEIVLSSSEVRLRGQFLIPDFQGIAKRLKFGVDIFRLSLTWLAVNLEFACQIPKNDAKSFSHMWHCMPHSEKRRKKEPRKILEGGKTKATKLYEYQIHLKSNKIFYYDTQNYGTHGNQKEWLRKCANTLSWELEKLPREPPRLNNPKRSSTGN